MAKTQFLSLKFHGKRRALHLVNNEIIIISMMNHLKKDHFHTKILSNFKFFVIHNTYLHINMHLTNPPGTQTTLE